MLLLNGIIYATLFPLAFESNPHLPRRFLPLLRSGFDFALTVRLWASYLLRLNQTIIICVLVYD